ncbi:MBOAT family O-acyltransferase [Lachnospira multipara]|uniref:MBOAT family O-acyltransferase n=1 Tax=Lachnospira multipara TaxID=28051 RepID=UPI000480C952|nr:MBOAT family O-acyltransferase [Lachnospira multipara]
MELYSLEFVIFIGVLLITYYGVETFFKEDKYGQGYQWIILLIANICFYSLCGITNLVYIFTTSVTTFAAGLGMSRRTTKYNLDKKSLKNNETQSKEARQQAKASLKKKYMFDKRLILVITLLINVGILAYLKYWTVIYDYFNNFAVRDLAESIEENVTGSGNTIFSASSIAIPLGISFYTFQSISYLIDMYNDKYSAETNFFKYLNFVSFFPQLIQGPINRYDQLGNQLNGRHKLEANNIQRGLIRLFYGFFKKFAVADMVSPIIMAAFRNIDSKTPGCIIVFGVLLYSVEQYCDFSGGIDMVMGVSKMLGIDMMENFRQPYFSKSLGEFWRRWHISLGAWMRDYIFYPVALTKPMQSLSKKCKKIKNKKLATHLSRTLPACLANLLVFFIVGLWHGAQMHFILWGIYNGMVIALSDLLSPIFTKITELLHINRENKYYKIFTIIRTFIVVNIGWYFDVLVDAKNSLLCLKNTFVYFKPAKLFKKIAECAVYKQNTCLFIAFIGCVVIFIVSLMKEKDIDVMDRLIKSPVIVRTLIYTAIILLMLVSFGLSSATSGAFMYANY